MQLGVKKGWSITAIKEGSGRTTAVTSLGALQAALARCKADSGHAWCTLTFSPKPVPPVAPLPTTPLPLAVQQGALAAGAWFLLKAAVGNKAHEWLGSVLAFSFCAVVAVRYLFNKNIKNNNHIRLVGMFSLYLSLVLSDFSGRPCIFSSHLCCRLPWGST